MDRSLNVSAPGTIDYCSLVDVYSVSLVSMSMGLENHDAPSARLMHWLWQESLHVNVNQDIPGLFSRFVHCLWLCTVIYVVLFD